MNPHDFLRAEGFGAATLHPLPADASFRRYTRLIGGPRPALLMEAPPPEDTRPFIRIAQHLLANGLSAPEIIAANKTAGLLVIEDFGPQTLAQLLDAGAEPVPLYAEAAEALARLHAAPPPPGLPAWNAAAMAKATAATFLDWWWPEVFGEPAAEAIRAELAEALHAMLAPFDAAGFVHRDYFPANLMRLPARDGARRIGILDFQDAALGHTAYDLVSLVEDARRDVAPEARRAAVAAYLRHRSGVSPNDLLAGMAAHGAQRHLRVAALWVRLARRDGKPAYLIHGPRCWRLLARSLSHPVCGPLVEFLDRHVPDERRGNPPSLAEAT